MTSPDLQGPPTSPATSKLFRAAIWIAIGALVAAAIVCVVWVLLGTQNDIVGRAFLTIFLLAAFGGVSILDARLAQGRRPWFALVSMASWVLALLIGAFLIWMPEGRYNEGFGGAARFLSFLLIVLVLQLAVLHIRLYSGYVRSRIAFNRVAAYVTLTLVVGLAVLLVLPLLLNEWLRFTDLFWRIVVAVSILAAVGTAIVPLVNALLAPKQPTPRPAAGQLRGQPQGEAPGQSQSGLQPWPTYVDGTTPLPYLPDGSPDWNAYYVGHPSTPESRAWTFPEEQHAPVEPAAVSAAPADAAAPAAPDAPGAEGYPPAPPLPPRS